jgi:isopenicillin-N N-acyltransferase like protein
MIPIQIGRKKQSPWRRLRRGLLWFLLLTGLAGVVLWFLFYRITRFVPPTGQAPSYSLVTEGRHTTYGPSSLTLHGAGKGHGSVWVLRLKGSPYEAGYAHGKLGNRLIGAADDHMFDLMAKYVPSSWNRWAMLSAVRWRHRSLADNTPKDHRLELAGLSAAILDEHRDVLPTYQRLLFYHATHDITQGLEHSPLLGCTAFALHGQSGAGGHLIIGRNFDFEGGEIFDREKAVIFEQTDGKIPFASVAWVGFAGVVTGINAQGVYISINAARTDDKAAVGEPVAFLARRVLEEAHNLDEAIAILKNAKTMVSDAFLVGDGRLQLAVVVEKSPTRFAVRRAKDGVWVTNHFLAQEFAKDGENDRLRRYLTSGYRYRRLTELVQGQRGVDARRAVDILRDRRGVNGTELGLGNRNAIDALIATHSVVVDATEMTLYVSATPNTLGRYYAFDLRRELGLEKGAEPAVDGAAVAGPADLPEDALLGTAAHADLLRARELMEHARALEQRKQRRWAIEEATQATHLAPGLPDAHKLVGDMWRRAGDPQRARLHYERFLALEPPHLADVEQVKAYLGTP